MSGGRERARLQGPGLPWWCSSWDFTPSAGGLGATPGQGSRSHISQRQIPSDTAETQHSQTKNNLKTRLQGLRRHTGRGQTAPHAPAVRGLPSCPSHWGADLSCTGGRRPVLVLSGAVHATALWWVWQGDPHPELPLPPILGQRWTEANAPEMEGVSRRPAWSITDRELGISGRSWTRSHPEAQAFC